MPQSSNLGDSEFPELDALVASKLQAKRSKQRALFVEDAAIMATRNEEFEALLAGYRSQFRPVGVHEDMLVRELAVSDWRLQVIARIETSVLWGQMQEIYQTELDGNDLSEVDDKTTSSLMGIAWFRNPSIFSLLVRYQNSARRAYYRALKQLELVRTGKAGYLPAVTAADQTKPTKGSKAAAAAAGNHPSPNGSAAPPEAEGRAVSAQTKPTPEPKVAVASAGAQTNPTERRAGAPEAKGPADSAPLEANCATVNGRRGQEVHTMSPETT